MRDKRKIDSKLNIQIKIRSETNVTNKYEQLTPCECVRIEYCAQTGHYKQRTQATS